MIKTLELHNFQSHKHSALEFNPGVNVIIGPTDSGKTAIIRALRWLVWNRPQGDSMRSTWGGGTSVEVRIDDTSVYRLKDKTDQYRLGKMEFTAFGAAIPEEIEQTLNLNEINLQQQLDSPFLLTSSPGDVAKHFNKVAHLDQIDTGLKNVQSWLREIDHSISSDEQREIQLTEELKEFEDLDKFEVQVEVLERLQTTMISQINQRRTLITLIEELKGIDQQIEEQKEILKAIPLLNQILDRIETRDEKEENRAKLVKLTETILYTTEKQIAAEKCSKQLQTEFNEIFPDVCPLCNQKIKK